MEQAIVYAIIQGIIGLGLLLFGLRLMKFAVSLIGFLIGMTIGPVLVQILHISPDLTTLLSIVAGVICAIVAFRFYRFIVTLSIAFFFGNLAYVIAQSSGAHFPWGILVGIAVGLFVFFLVRSLKLVDVFFAVTTSAQGAGGIVAALYILFNPAHLESIQSHSSAVAANAGGIWIIAWIITAIAGFSYQLRYLRSRKQEEE